jgi:catechol 2,3-dioxygenase-like lactoylglutathione lyase family enzyme
MDLTIHSSFLPQDDPDASLAFYRDTLGFEVRNDVGHGGMRWITIGPPGQPGTSVVLYPPQATPGLTDDATFERLQGGDVEIVQEPTDQPYGIRDCSVRDPAGNLLRIQQLA